ncbi:MAG: lipoyl(octanoyl) transferase LipB [Chloroflexi bacterium]|nr:lipoyl(octanoyl) transferase LipB [Chloroflexota bacterium]
MPPAGGGSTPGLLAWLGRLDFAEAWALQRALAVARRERPTPDLLLLVEHPPTITIGRSGSERHLLAGAAELAAIGATVIAVDRGGDITYHGPGQLVAYPIIDLHSRGRDIHRYLRLLEEAVIRALADVGVAASRLPPHTGVWVGEEKIAAIGVKVSRGVTLHGLALNIDPDLSHFDAIVPCGIHDKGVTSVARVLGRPPAPELLAARLTHHLGALLGVAWRGMDARALPATARLAAIVAMASLTATTPAPIS